MGGEVCAEKGEESGDDYVEGLRMLLSVESVAGREGVVGGGKGGTRRLS